MKKIIYPVAVAGLSLAAISAQAQIADWTFETSIPATAGPFSPEVGAGSALAFHSGVIGAPVYSSPAGNGSSHSFSSNGWNVGDYYQFQVSTVGLGNVLFQWDQTSSNTGPGHFQLSYSTDGTNFTAFGAVYTVLANGTPNPAWNATTGNSAYTSVDDLSAVLAINNQANVYFRLINTDTVAANSANPVAATGTDRVDNVIINARPVPEPATLAALGLGAIALIRRRRK